MLSPAISPPMGLAAGYLAMKLVLFPACGSGPKIDISEE